MAIYLRIRQDDAKDAVIFGTKPMHRYEGTEYRFEDLGSMSCADIALAQKSLLFGRIAVNTSIDSGLLLRPDWPRAGDYCHTPAISEKLIGDWPVSHDGCWDEWWVFDCVVPADFKVKAFCNYNMCIAEYKKLDFQTGCRLDHYLEQFRPIAVFGNNEAAGYLIQKTGRRTQLVF